MNPSANSTSRWKVPEISSYIQERREKNHFLPFIVLTETWLKSYVSDAQLQIPGYQISRSDRDARIGGGVLLYSHANVPVSECQTFDDGTCEGLFCKFDTITTCVVVAYRPPNATAASFSALLDFFSSCISQVNDDSYDMMITGDYNLPAIDWQTCTVLPGGSADSQLSSRTLLEFMSEHLLSQYVLCPTRGSNVLDLFITNNDRLVTNVQSDPTSMSDHNVVDIMLAWNPVSIDQAKVPSFDENSFRSLDFHRADFDALRNMLSEVNWELLRSSCSFEEFPVKFTDTLFQICSECVPCKTVPTGRPRHVNA